MNGTKVRSTEAIREMNALVVEESNQQQQQKHAQLLVALIPCTCTAFLLGEKKSAKEKRHFRHWPNDFVRDCAPKMASTTQLSQLKASRPKLVLFRFLSLVVPVALNFQCLSSVRPLCTRKRATETWGNETRRTHAARSAKRSSKAQQHHTKRKQVKQHRSNPKSAATTFSALTALL